MQFKIKMLCAFYVDARVNGSEERLSVTFDMCALLSTAFSKSDR